MSTHSTCGTCCSEEHNGIAEELDVCLERRFLLAGEGGLRRVELQSDDNDRARRSVMVFHDTRRANAAANVLFVVGEVDWEDICSSGRHRCFVDGEDGGDGGRWKESYGSSLSLLGQLYHGSRWPQSGERVKSRPKMLP